MKRTLLLATGMVLVFAVTVGVLLNVLPGPHKSTDFLVIGAIATLLCLLLLFFVLTKTMVKHPSASYKDQKTDPEA
jgi:Na+/melibiose symporter-like transporter